MLQQEPMTKGDNLPVARTYTEGPPMNEIYQWLLFGRTYLFACVARAKTVTLVTVLAQDPLFSDA